MAERNHVGPQISRNFVDGAPAKTAAYVATVAGLFRQKVQRGLIFDIGPIEPAIEEVSPDRFDRLEKLALFNGERTNREIDRRALLQTGESFEQSQGILAT